ncbi:uncharacterized protein [Diadema setosum]|uniref:uncharacterized protein n=1 Tax=Diadema setosum TaxID=31175 RepID=UPI003B3B26E9
MDDSERFPCLYRNTEINGNEPTPGQSEFVDDNFQESPGFDDTDSSSPKVLSPVPDIIDRVAMVSSQNDNDDAGYYSQDPKEMPSLYPEVTNANRNQQSILNNNLRPLNCRGSVSSGKVYGVSMPPNYIVNSNSRRTSFGPSSDKNSLDVVNSQRDKEIVLRKIPSPTSPERGQNENGSFLPELSSRNNQISAKRKLEYIESECQSSRSSGAQSATGSFAKQTCDNDKPSSEDATSGTKKRKRRDGDDESDGNADSTTDMVEPDNKRMRGAELLPRQPSHPPAPQGCMVQGPARSRPNGSNNQYEIQGQNNWVVESPQHCTFHIYQSQGSEAKGQHPVEWAGISIHEVNDAALKNALQEVAKVISQAGNWKRFARILPVTRSPSLEQDLRGLEACPASPRDKALTVLLRWWREECGCSLGGEVKEKLRGALEDCRLVRMARSLDKLL